MPIVRTFAPFVAGIGKMSYPRFAVYNVVGGSVWVASFLLAGWWFGGLETVQKNFHYVIAAIIVISVLPAIVEALRVRMGGPNRRIAWKAERSPLSIPVGRTQLRKPRLRPGRSSDRRVRRRCPVLGGGCL